ncbi:MAG: hypothetical protein P1U61_04995 [Legionellaceae bacterium]|nr:hypothetical protein [Legionellaceae bacterium]
MKVFQLLLQSGGVKQFFQLIADYHVIEDALLSWKGGEVEGLFSSEESDCEEVTGLEKQGHVNACDSFDFNESVACNMNYERDDIRVRKKHGFFSASDNARDEDERNDEVYVPSKKHRSI